MNEQTQDEFIAYLQRTLIPDLRESGKDATAEDFDTIIDFLQGATESNGWDVENFISFLEETLIPDLLESGAEFTAGDFKTGIRFLKAQ